jgi:exopolysaccharide biosynthesis polyprenyl glycosylphosphotransferase
MSILEPTTDSAHLAGVATHRPAPAVAPRVAARRWLAVAPIVDALILTFAVTVERLGGRALGDDNMSVAWVVAFPAITMALLAAGGLYRDRLRLQLLDDLRTIAGATAIASMATIALPVLLGAESTGLPAQGVRLWLFATVYLTASRGGIISSVIASRRHSAAVPTLIVGAGTVGRLIAKRLAEHREIGLAPIGFLDKEPRKARDDELTLPVLGASWDLEDVIETHQVRHVIFTFSTAPHDVMLRMVDECNRRGIRVSLVPRLFERLPRDMSIDHLGGVPLLSIHPVSPTSWRFHVKYAVDRLVALLTLVVLAPLLLAVAIGVLLSVGRPIFFRQRRVGRDGRTFEMLKVRSMRGSATVTRIDGVPVDLGPGGVEGDDRRTRFGIFLRRSSLDELAQLINVVRGDMSIVGPRPERPEFVELFDRNVHRYSDRHRVKSGITGWAQISGLRGKTSLANRVEWDNWYIENWSPWLDFKILLRTAGAVVRAGSTVE